MEQELKTKIESLIQSESLFLFLKGNPTFPRCGFSNQVVQILTAFKVPFGHFDILSDEEVRQGVKVFSDWPTFPQLYVKGELYGGCDIVREAFESGELLEAFREALPDLDVQGPKPPASVQHISPAEANAKLAAEPQSKFLDVRTVQERETACVEGFSMLDEGLVQEMVSTWDRETPLVFMCHYGGRSAQAADYFTQQGFQNVFNVAGGIDAWAQSVDPKLVRY